MILDQWSSPLLRCLSQLVHFFFRKAEAISGANVPDDLDVTSVHLPTLRGIIAPPSDPPGTREAEGPLLAGTFLAGALLARALWFSLVPLAAFLLDILACLPLLLPLETLLLPNLGPLIELVGDPVV